MKPWISLVALAASAAAQSYSGHSGWNFDDTMQTATDVVVADLPSGTALDNGTLVSVKSKLRVVRVLAGTLLPGAEVPVEWQYRPMGMQPPEVTSKVPAARGIWFLQRGSDGKLKLLQANGMPLTLGGYYLPAGDAPRFYAQDAPLQQKIAFELAPVLEQFVNERAADLAKPPQVPDRAAGEARARYFEIMSPLRSLGKAATAEVYAHFSTLANPYLKLPGIEGRLMSGDSSALVDLEKALPLLSPILSNGGMGTPMAGGLDLRNDMPAAHALGRLALSETALPGIEGSAAFTMAQTRSPEVLPYFMAMLESPNPSTRGTALMAFCWLLRPRGDMPGNLWAPEMNDHCPNQSPLNDAGREDRNTRFWKDWWAAHREELANKWTLPTAAVPARYRAPRQEVMQAPIEVRFQSLVHMATTQPEHFHDASGKVTAGPPPGQRDFVRGQLSGSDGEVYDSIIAATKAKLDGTQKKVEELMNRARLTRVMPGRDQMAELEKERQAALTTGLQDLRTRLTPAGWQAVEKFLTGMGGSMVVGTIAK